LFQGFRLAFGLFLFHPLSAPGGRSYTRQKIALLDAANLKVEMLRHLVRLAKDLQVLNVSRYEHAARLLDDVGRQIGGWRRSRRGSEQGS
jgi:hypothetical protein